MSKKYVSSVHVFEGGSPKDLQKKISNVFETMEEDEDIRDIKFSSHLDVNQNDCFCAIVIIEHNQ